MRGPDAGGMSFCLLLLCAPIWNIADGSARPVWAAALGLAATAALYVWTVRLGLRGPFRAAAGPLAALAVLTGLLAVHFQDVWFLLPILTSAAFGVSLRHRIAPLAFLGWALVTVALCFVGPSGDGSPAGLGNAVSMFWGAFTSALVPWVVLRLFEVIALLRETRQELARSAVAEERLRFARDLHDLLGHTLSLIVVKAEAVRRVLPGDAVTAADQAADIERIGRQALTEVRAAVTGYRGRGLTAELDSARTALADAGIDATVRTRTLSLTPAADALLGWTVREGVTNVLRHSAARTCRISLDQGDDDVVLEIRDDGNGASGPGAEGDPDGSPGHGLRGLRERLAAAGGRLDAAGVASGGFRLEARVPVDAP
jgi:two-component system sensor histidine kinase DesK